MAAPYHSGSAAVASAEMPFILSSDDGRVDPALRRFIRSHAMRGRKQKRIRPRRNLLVGHGDTVAGYGETAPVHFEDITRIYTPLRGRIGSDLSFVTLPEDLDPSILLNITKVSPIAQRVAYPLIAAIGIQHDNREWLHLCTQDAAVLHITAFSVEGFIDMFLHGREQINTAAMVHFQKGLSILRERLSGQDEKLKASDATIGIVLKLATAAHIAGDYQAAQYHMDGVRKMIDYRGGLDCLKASHLFYEMLRCDLSIAMSGERTHVFFRQPPEPMPEYPFALLPDFKNTVHSQDTAEIIGRLAKDLATVWSVMRRFCLLVNLGEQTQRLISTTVINETMTSTMYRLIDMEYPVGSLNEAVRLGLLAYAYHVFLQWRSVTLPYQQFRKAFESCILGLEQRKEVSSRFVLWMTTVGAVSVFDLQDEAWRREALHTSVSACEARSWKQVQNILKAFMWIPLLDDHPGRNIFDSLD